MRLFLQRSVQAVMAFNAAVVPNCNSGTRDLWWKEQTSAGYVQMLLPELSYEVQGDGWRELGVPVC